MKSSITPLLLTFNEGPNLARTLGRLAWARDVVVVDSGSTDDTCAIAAGYPNVRVFQHPFTSHADQWNFGLEQTGITTEWVFAMDADYILSDECIEELGRLSPDPGTVGYQASFVYCINGRPLRGAAYPPVVVLYRRAGATYLQDGHTQRIRVDGAVLPLAGHIFHDDRKPLAHWLASQVRYQQLEADKLMTTPRAALGLVDRVRLLVVVAPPAMFVYCYLLRGGFLDGTAGFFYALQRTTAELMLSMNLVDRKLGRSVRKL